MRGMSGLDARMTQGVFDGYLADLRYKKSTITGKKSCLKQFFAYLDERGIEDLREVSALHIQGFFEDLRGRIVPRTGRPYSPSSLLGFQATLRLLFACLYQGELVLKNPLRELELHLGGRSRPRAVFTEAEIAAFLDGIDIHVSVGLRDRAMFELMYSSGLRSSEVVKLNRGDIELESRMAIVRDAKWSKDRVVPVNEVAHAFLSLYLADTAQGEHPTFLGARGRMSAHSLRARFRHHLVNAGLQDKGLSPHSIRHATATHLLAHGADLRYVQELLGHQSIETTVLYTNEALENLKRIYKTHHPRENALWREVDEEYRRRAARLLARLEDPRLTAHREWMRKQAMKGKLHGERG
jgi:site-specific recombinase XerD